MEWISVNDRLPGYNQSVIVYGRGDWFEKDDGPEIFYEITLQHYDGIPDYWLYQDGDKIIDVTHWMEEPAPPTVKESEDV